MSGSWRPWAGRALVAALLVLAAALTGCRPSRAGQVAGASGAAQAPRDIPLVFYVLSGPGEPNTTTDADIWGAVALANQVFSEARVSFYVHALLRFDVALLHRNDDGDERLPWSAVAGDAIKLAPAMAKAGFDDAHRAHRTIWLSQVAARLPRDGVTVFVVPFTGTNGKMWGSNCASPFPHNDGAPFYDPGPGRAWSRDGSKGIFCTPAGRFAGHHVDALAHELGHYIGGLNHTFDALNAAANAAEGVAPEDYYDLLYAPTPDGRGIVRFDTREQARQAGARVAVLDSNCERCGANLSRRVVPKSQCVTEYRIPVAGGSMTLDAARHVDALRGLAFAPLPGDPRYGINVMSYLHSDPETTPCAFRLSRSQIELVQRKLREPMGHRNELGTLERARIAPPASAFAAF